MPAANSELKDRAVARQDAAESAFNQGDIETALHNYRVAESLYRQAFTTPGDRIFFMQASALRCLEELFDRGYSHLLPELRAARNRFFQEWTGKTIDQHVSNSRQREARAFLTWRHSHAFAAPSFELATAAADAGNFDRARGILQAFLATSSAIPVVERDLLVAIARSKLHILDAKEEHQKPEHVQDSERRARAYEAAAAASEPTAGVSPAQTRLLSAYALLFRSEAHKIRAFDTLRRSSYKTTPEDSFVTAAAHFDAAVECADRAITLGAPVTPSHAMYLRYWYAVVSERLALMSLMRDGTEVNLTAAYNAWSDACTISSLLPESICFPNRFYSRQDLTLERHFIDAASAFRRRDFTPCAVSLHRWLDEFPSEYRFSWRFVQVSVRAAFVDTTLAIIRHDRAGARSSANVARELRTELLGNSGRQFALQTEALAGLMPQNVDGYDFAVLDLLFPLDAYAEQDDVADQHEPWNSWPVRIRRWIEQSKAPMTRWEIEEAKIRVCGAIEALQIILVDYYAQILPAGISVSLIDDCHETLAAYFGQTSVPVRTHAALVNAIAKLRRATGERDYALAYAEVLGLGRVLSRIVPVVSDVDSQIDPRTKVRPDWSHADRAGRSEIIVDGTLPSGRWYLPPEYRKGDRTFVPASQVPLLVRSSRTPEWRRWEDRAAAAAALKDAGVSWEMLRRSVDLAATCVNEDDDPRRPKVAALIVRDGQVIAEAVRNEDGEGGHAEEIALRKVGKAGAPLLNGATVVTTLEPCTRFRSPSRTPCMKLLVLNGISSVVIGIADPNPGIRGEAIALFPENQIRTYMFPLELQTEIIALNREFIDSHIQARTVKLPM